MRHTTLKPKQSLNWLGRVILQLLCGRVSKLGPRGEAALARLASGVLWCAQRQKRALMLELMRQALGDSYSQAQLQHLCRQAYRQMGLTLTEILRLAETSPAELAQQTPLEGEEHLRQARAAGRGVILITGHFGNWELLGARLAHFCGTDDFYVIGQPQRDQALTRLIDSIRHHHGLQVIPRGSAAREVLRALKKGGVVGILMDVDVKGNGIFVDFLGRPASTTTGPAAYALRTGAAVFLTFDLRQPDGRHVCHVVPVELTQTGRYEQDLQDNTARFNQLIAAQVQAHPEQWLWLPNRWRSTPPVS